MRVLQHALPKMIENQSQTSNENDGISRHHKLWSCKFDLILIEEVFYETTVFYVNVGISINYILTNGYIKVINWRSIDKKSDIHIIFDCSS